MDAVRVRGSGLVGAVAPVVLVWWWRGWDGESEMDWIGSVRSVHHLWLCCQCENINVTRGALAVDVSSSGWTEEYGSSLFQLIAKTE